MENQILGLFIENVLHKIKNLLEYLQVRKRMENSCCFLQKNHISRINDWGQKHNITWRIKFWAYIQALVTSSIMKVMELYSESDKI